MAKITYIDMESPKPQNREDKATEQNPTGFDRKAYQKAYMREYMRARRAKQQSNSDSGSASDNHSPSDPQSSSVQALPNPPQTS
jgi:hypothetical protein